MKDSFVFGIDEAGRGPLAGPVAVAVFGKKKSFKLKGFPKGKDSKKMTQMEREYWFEILKEHKKEGKVCFEFAFCSNGEIDRKGIVPGIESAMAKCLKNLAKKSPLTRKSKLLLDGALHAPKEFFDQTTIIKGDEKEIVISCASVIAKVTRDEYMRKQGKKYPSYGFERHKGYGTRLHKAKIAELGLCMIHRRSFGLQNY